MKASKPSRNDLCPCGSGKKYKKCCLIRDTLAEELSRNVLPKEVTDYFNEQKRKEIQWKSEYGDVKPIIHNDFNGHKFVAVGNRLCYSDQWKTFIDFLIYFAAGVLGSDWGNAEIKKPFTERHQIMQWYDGMCRYQQTHSVLEEDGVYSCIPNGDYEAFINLAYDLYILNHHLSIQQDIIRRIKDKQQFQGARYELFVAATCIRAGYDIEYEDETDVTRKHPEFLGIHRKSGQRIHVEAKSKHRSGILGYNGEKQDGNLKANVGYLLSKAISKVGKYPFVIFIDLNLSPLTQEKIRTDLFEELQGTVDYICANYEKDPFNLIIFTNHPCHYGAKNEPSPHSNTLMTLSTNPLIVPSNLEAILNIFTAAEQYGNIPKYFPE